MTDDLADYIAENYGTCDRDKPEQNDCYWGKDALGRWNGCLRTVWRGRRCPHWKPVAARTWDELRAFHMEASS